MTRTALYILAILLVPAALGAQDWQDAPALQTDEAFIYDLCFSEGGSVLAVADGNRIGLYSMEDYSLTETLEGGHSAQILALDLSADSSLMLSGDRDGKLVLWDVAHNSPLESLDYHEGQVTSVAISADNRFLVSGGSDARVYVYDLAKQSLAHELRDHLDAITAVTISRDGRLLATASGDRTVRLYELESGTLLHSFAEHKSWVRDVVFSPDGRMLYSCGDRSMLISCVISDPSAPGRITRRKAGKGWILCMDHHPHENVTVTSGLSGQLRIQVPTTEFRTQVDVPVHRVRFMPLDSPYMRVAVATRGRGVLILSSRDMKVKN